MFRASALIMFSACCFGSISILAIMGMNSGATLTTLLIGRYAVAIAVLLMFARRLGLRSTPPRRALLLMTFFGGAQAAVAYLSLAALAHIPAATMSFLFYTFPAMVAVMAVVSGSEKLTVRKVGALLLSLAGITVLVGAPLSGASNATGVVLALGAGAVYAVYVVAIGRMKSESDPAATTLYISIGAALIFLLLGSITGDIAVRPNGVALLVMLGLGLVSTVMAFFAFLRGLAVLGPVRTAIISTVEPFWTAILAATVLSQPLTIGILAGGAIIAAAVILLQLGRSQTLQQ